MERAFSDWSSIGELGLTLAAVNRERSMRGLGPLA